MDQYEKELQEVFREEDPSLPRSVAERYLNTYVADIDWGPSLRTLLHRLPREEVKKAIACACLIRVSDRSVPLDTHNPQSLLLRVQTFHQYQSHDWWNALQSVARQDHHIAQWRKAARRLGIIDPIEYQPYTRQAFNWMYAKAEDTGVATEATKDEVSVRLKRLVWIYGGCVICNIFSRHEDAIKRIFNWRTGYFMERQIFHVYDIEQVLKIKHHEIEETNERLIKKL